MEKDPENPELLLASSATPVVIIVAMILLPMVYHYCFVVSEKVVTFASSYF